MASPRKRTLPFCLRSFPQGLSSAKVSYGEACAKFLGFCPQAQTEWVGCGCAARRRVSGRFPVSTTHFSIGVVAGSYPLLPLDAVAEGIPQCRIRLTTRVHRSPRRASFDKAERLEARVNHQAIAGLDSEFLQSLTICSFHHGTSQTCQAAFQQNLSQLRPALQFRWKASASPQTVGLVAQMAKATSNTVFCRRNDKSSYRIHLGTSIHCSCSPALPRQDHATHR